MQIKLDSETLGRIMWLGYRAGLKNQPITVIIRVIVANAFMNERATLSKSERDVLDDPRTSLTPPKEVK